MSKTYDEIVQVMSEIRDLVDQMEKRNREMLEAIKEATK